MNTMKTQRGFRRVDFTDDNGDACSLQESSAMRDSGLIWLGLDKVCYQVFCPGDGWAAVPPPEARPGGSVMDSGRMHLSQETVASLLPYLIHFAETGRLGYDDET